MEEEKIHHFLGITIKRIRKKNRKRYYIGNFKIFSKRVKKSTFKEKCFYGLTRIFLVMQPFFKKDGYLLFDNLNEEATECIDNYCLFKYMQENNIKSYYVLWEKNKLYETLKLSGEVKNIILLKDSRIVNKFEFFIKCFFKLLTTKNIITSFGLHHFKISNLFYKNKYINYVFSQHGVILLKISVLLRDYLTPKRFNKCVVSNDIEKEILKNHGWKEKDLITVGLARWEYLKKENNEQKTIFMMPTWRSDFAVKNKFNSKNLIEKSEYFKHIYNFLSDKRLNDLLINHNIKLIYSVHHTIIYYILHSNYKDVFKDLSNIEIADSNNISKYIKKSSLLITDYSSVAFDFLFLNTPVIFYRHDYKDSNSNSFDKLDRDNSASKDNLLFNTYYEKEGVIDCIEKYIKNNFMLEEENIKKASLFFKCKTDICKKLVEEIEKI